MFSKYIINSMIIKFIAVLILQSIAILAQAQIVGKLYDKKTFLNNFKSVKISGEIQKIVYWKSIDENYYMVLSKKIAIDTNVEVDYIYAYGFTVKNGILSEEWKFQDFGNPIYWPRFYLKQSNIVDTDKNGLPEYILAYFGSSDGLDAKPLKIITYINGIKYKATALYPAGNENDEYKIIYDANWNLMPKSTQAYILKLFKTLKPYPLYEYKN